MLLCECCDNPGELTLRAALADAVREAGWADAAERIAGGGDMKRNKWMKTETGYKRWVSEVLEQSWTVVANTSTQLAMFIGSEDGEWRHALLDIENGLPHRLRVDLPVLIDYADVLFRFPIEEVSITDRRPEYDSHGYFWNRVPYPQKHNTWIESLDHIPNVILFPNGNSDRIRDGGESWSSGFYNGFPTVRDAMWHLNLLCRSYGKSRRAARTQTA
jgi:hypothetical protein